MKLLKPIQEYIKTLDTVSLSEERKAILHPLIAYINSKTQEEQIIQLNFICTHNSRRSHLAQVWAQAMASYFNIPNIACFSGGTEATAVYPMVIQTLEKAGFQISIDISAENPVYHITFTTDKTPLLAFSKKYDDDANPKSCFAAIMTCSQADAGCPFVAGSEKRISIMYEDPKVSDGTSEQKKVYKERSEQIATEMKYVFSQINS
ncbi:low molecular weight phosphatase family protein [Aequorivita antarctica]|uniref:Protein-tyrosine-phosphatase n=1 Tax=Aequorivita antarctica TaxID=153266 RepID=A0A5C6YXF0_9FLAO|nr:protein-tyrosine-phosphatase [Aequorivita antarctica]TXD72363.1 protein-tyrosine-phosphatase [Aequorivita antarctica]SRX74506.1 Protein ArsC [Aequorivita antarctica]